MSEHELTDGRRLPVIAEFSGVDYDAYVLQEVEAAHEWLVTWSDGINEWLEEYDYPWHALARFTALVAACEQQVFLVHDVESRGERAAFVEEAERFVSRTVHASSCGIGCDGTDDANHQV